MCVSLRSYDFIVRMSKSCKKVKNSLIAPCGPLNFWSHQTNTVTLRVTRTQRYLNRVLLYIVLQ